MPTRLPVSLRKNYRYAANHGFKYHQTEGVGTRRKNKGVHAKVRCGQFLASTHAGKLRALKMLPQPVLLATIAYNQEFKIRSTAAMSLRSIPILFSVVKRPT
jgi:hypothetical protein